MMMMMMVINGVLLMRRVTLLSLVPDHRVIKQVEVVGVELTL